MEDTYGRTEKWDPAMKRPLDSYMKESIAKGWQMQPSDRPRIFFEAGGNVLRRFRAYDKVTERLLPTLDLMVTIDWRMSHTPLYSDYVLPAAAGYEKDDITWATPLSPVAQVITRAAEPIAEAKPDWESHCLLLKTIQKRAAERGQVLCLPGHLRAAQIFHAQVQAVPGIDPPLRHAEALKFHTGTVETPAKVHLLEGKGLEGSQTGLATIVTAHPVAAAAGDRFLLRRPSPAASTTARPVASRPTTSRPSRSKTAWPWGSKRRREARHACMG